MLEMVGPLHILKMRKVRIISKVVLASCIGLLALSEYWNKTCLPLSKRQCNENILTGPVAAAVFL
jgi:hypothetical protein